MARRQASKPSKAAIAAAVEQIKNRYDAGGNGPRVKHWSPPASGPQKALQGFERMRSRVHDAVRNDWAAKSSVQKWVTNLIGTGIQPRFKVKAHRAVWDKFAKTADADGVLDVYGLQVLMGRALFDGGEAFLRRRPRDLNSPLDVPVQIQVIEGEFCPMFDADVWPGMPVGNKINQGIERNKYGTRTAYWFYREHPGDGAIAPSRDQLIRVAASQVAHVYEVDRPGQLRGVSPLSAILLRLREAADLEGVVLNRQKIANLFAMFITRAMPENDDLEFDPLTGLPKWYDVTGLQPMAGLEAGISQELRPGEDVKFASPPPPGVGYAEYMRSNHVGNAAGQGLPYELMSGDIKDISDRTLRVIIQEFRRYCQQRQWITLIPMGCQRMLDWCMDAAAMARLLPLSQLDAAKVATWTPQGWDYIHPVQDAEGKKILLGMGVISKTSIITERGDEPEKVYDERRDDAQAEDVRDIKLDADGTLLADAPEPVAPVGQAAQNLERMLEALVDTQTKGAAQAQQALDALAQMAAQAQREREAQAKRLADADEQRRADREVQAQRDAAADEQRRADREVQAQAAALMQQALAALVNAQAQAAALAQQEREAEARRDAAVQAQLTLMFDVLTRLAPQPKEPQPQT